MDIPCRKIPVSIPPRAYDVIVSRGIVGRAGDALRTLSTSRRVCVMTDSSVGPIYLPALEQSLRAAGFEPVIATISPGEDNKTLATLLPAYDTFLSARIERSTPLIALGGGIVGDMAGFLAATILRGVPFVQMPTTLLAMVDASVGGKTGVNHAVGKNLIGAFHQPIAVLIDPEVLRTLPPRELHGGFAECIKHDIIRDAAGFAALPATLARAIAVDIDCLADLIAHNVEIKAKVVAADPHERGERAHLNLGHTFAHAIETVSGHAYSHGEAVSLGIVAAAHVASQIGLLTDAERTAIITTLQAAKLPTSGLKLNTSEVVAAMAFDKKVEGGRIRLVLPDGIGRAVIRDDIQNEVISEAVESLKS